MSAAAKTVTGSDGTVFKSANAASDTTYVRLGQLSKGDTVVEGIFIGTSQNTMYKDKLDYKFKGADGKSIVVNEGGNLKARMKDIAAGTLVMIIYQGKQKITKGAMAGKEAHNVEVLLAD